MHLLNSRLMVAIVVTMAISIHITTTVEASLIMITHVKIIGEEVEMEPGRLNGMERLVFTTATIGMQKASGTTITGITKNKNIITSLP